LADTRAKPTGTVYRDEAAELMAAAARASIRQAPPPEPEPPARRAAPDLRLEPKRPLPYPEPVGFNDNDDGVYPDDVDDIRQAPRRQRRRLSSIRLIAWIVLAPLYIAVAAASVGIIILLGTRLLAG
jgi:hypothetical protein